MNNEFIEDLIELCARHNVGLKVEPDNRFRFWRVDGSISYNEFLSVATRLFAVSQADYSPLRQDERSVIE
jgi:hypothetical protein